jgi:hypothetical protein
LDWNYAGKKVGDILPIEDVSVERLIELLLDQPWHKDCVIIPDYMPSDAGENTKPSVQVHYRPDIEYNPRLRYSNGPKQGFFWDIYGENMKTVELAIIALSMAPVPIDVSPTVFRIAPAKKGGE